MTFCGVVDANKTDDSCARNLLSSFQPPTTSSSNAASGISSQTNTMGEGSVGGNTSGKGSESNAGGREMGDSDSSMKGDTSSKPNVNNEAPSGTKEIKTDKESDQFSSDGSSKATF
ncbi:hypothetical protein JCM16303_006028 [Sporobolomyces ruberrimus]